MRKTYINGVGCISAQKTFDTVFLEEATVNESENVLPIQVPVYKDYISPVAIRRMAKGVKNGVLEKIHTPIGLEIYAETPEEIAISIIAEIIKVYRSPS